MINSSSKRGRHKKKKKKKRQLVFKLRKKNHWIDNFKCNNRFKLRNSNIKKTTISISEKLRSIQNEISSFMLIAINFAASKNLSIQIIMSINQSHVKQPDTRKMYKIETTMNCDTFNVNYISTIFVKKNESCIIKKILFKSSINRREKVRLSSIQIIVCNRIFDERKHFINLHIQRN